MLAHLRPTLVLLAVFTLITGGVYPALVTAVGQLAWPDRANGSPVLRDGRVVGSALIGQSFTEDRWFRPRPSATSAPDPADASKTIDAPYNASASSGSNLGPITGRLVERVRSDVGALRAAGIEGPIPADLVTTSASGLDPHITPEAALSQVARVAAARGLDPARVRGLVETSVEGRVLGVIGEPRVNVLTLNIALERLR